MFSLPSHGDHFLLLKKASNGQLESLERNTSQSTSNRPWPNSSVVFNSSKLYRLLQPFVFVFLCVNMSYDIRTWKDKLSFCFMTIILFYLLGIFSFFQQAFSYQQSSITWIFHVYPHTGYVCVYSLVMSYTTTATVESRI